MSRSLVEFVRNHSLWGNRKRNTITMYNVVYYIRFGNAYIGRTFYRSKTVEIISDIFI